jgi:Zn-finger nucleic acid-binding protein
VTPADWGELLEDHAAEQRVLAQMVPPLPGRAIPEASLAQLIRCPVCRHEMDRYRFAALTDITVDACADHGIWFDARELAAVIRRVSAREEATRLGTVTPEDDAAEREWSAHISNVQRSVADKASGTYDEPQLEGTLAFLALTLVRR